jgi:DNA-binding IclR family transcriptional regulator
MSKNDSSQTVYAALHLLDIVATHRGVTLTEIARTLNMTLSRTHRLLGTLEQSGYLSRGIGKVYHLGPKLLFLGHRSAQGNPLLRAASPVLDSLSRSSGETALLAIRFGIERLIVDSRDSRFGPQAAWPNDARLPLHSGALGICLLSYAPSQILTKLMANGLVCYTPSTIADAESLHKAIISVQQNGAYVSKNSYQEGVYSIAAPILGGQREAVAAVAIVGNTARLDPDKEQEYADIVRQGASDISKYLT